MVVKLLKPMAGFMLLLSIIISPGVNAQEFGGSSLLDGAFTEEQAINGQTLYYDHCLQCHGEAMNGVDQAPPLAGPQFASNWSGETLMSLVERMNTMPPDRPGVLSRQQAVDLLAFILWFNELPLGTTPMASDRDSLMNIVFETPTPQY